MVQLSKAAAIGSEWLLLLLLLLLLALLLPAACARAQLLLLHFESRRAVDCSILK